MGSYDAADRSMLEGVGDATASCCHLCAQFGGFGLAAGPPATFLFIIEIPTNLPNKNREKRPYENQLDVVVGLRNCDPKVCLAVEQRQQGRESE